MSQIFPVWNQKRRLRKHWTEARAIGYKYLDVETCRLSELFFQKGVETFDNANYLPVFVHGDLTDRNILINANTGKPTGILDWGDSAFVNNHDPCTLMIRTRLVRHRSFYYKTSIVWGSYLVRMGRLRKTFLLSMLLGFSLLGISAAATHEPWGVSDGFPFLYSYPNPPTCGKINPMNGCGYSYDPVLVGLDSLFWLAIAVVAVSAIDLTWNRFLSPPSKNAKA